MKGTFETSILRKFVGLLKSVCANAPTRLMCRLSIFTSWAEKNCLIHRTAQRLLAAILATLRWNVFCYACYKMHELDVVNQP